MWLFVALHLHTRVERETLAQREGLLLYVLDGILAALQHGDRQRLARRMYNVFEDVLDRRAGEINAIKSTLLDYGALGAVMSGTGSAVFGLFPDRASAENAWRALHKNYRECFCTETIDRLEV